MRAVEHEHGGAGRLVLALVNLQVGVFDVERQIEAFALDGAGESRGDVEVEGVAELVGFGGAAGFDAGGQVAGVVASEAGFAEGAEQVAQGFEAEEVEALVGDFEFGLLRFSGLSADAGLARGVVRLVDGDVVFLLHALDQFFDQLVELAVGGHFLEALAHVVVELIAFHERLFDGAAEVIEGLLALGHFVPHVALEAALQQVIGERAEQVFHAHFAGGVGDVFGVANAFHK